MVTDVRAPHLALVAMFYPPSRASGVYRPLAMANFFVERGWRVTVVTADRGFFDDVTGSADPELETRIDPRVTVERVRVPRESMIRDIRRMSARHARYPRLYAASLRLRGRIRFPDKYSAWIPGVVHRLRKVHRHHRFDVVVATGNPWSAFRAAQRFARRASVPYVIDYRDSWTLDQYAAKPLFAEGSRQVAWERRVLDGAALITHVNQRMLDWHAERYPDAAPRMMVLQNGTDTEYVSDVRFRRPADDEGVRFGYVGTITRQLPHDVMWEAWARARRDPALADATLSMYGHLGFFPWDVDEIKRLLPLGVGTGVSWEGAVSKTVIGGVYDSLDVVVSMVPPSPFVTAGKTYEGLATGRIMVGVHSPDTAAAEPLSGYPSGLLPASLDADAVARSLVEAAVLARSRTEADFDACREYAARFDRRRLLKPFEEALLAVLDAR